MAKLTSTPKYCPVPAVVWATAGGVGLLKPAPGTWGSALAVGLALVVLAVCGSQLGRGLLIIATVIAVVGSYWAVPRAARWFGRGDPGQIVIDEVVGVWLGVVICPDFLLVEPLTAVLVVGILFRVFDIAKPGPVGFVESLHGTTGIMADDLVAGLLAGLLTTAILY